MDLIVIYNFVNKFVGFYCPTSNIKETREHIYKINIQCSRVSSKKDFLSNIIVKGRILIKLKRELDSFVLLGHLHSFIRDLARPRDDFFYWTVAKGLIT